MTPHLICARCQSELVSTIDEDGDIQVEPCSECLFAAAEEQAMLDNDNGPGILRRIAQWFTA